MIVKKANKFLILISLTILAFGPLIYANRAVFAQEYALQIAFIDVGEGDAALIQNSDGYNVLIDGGIVSEGPTILAYLHDHGVNALNAIVASHADSDHIGGLIAVLNATDITVDSVIYNGYPGDTQTWNNFVTAISNEGLSLTTAQYPSALQWGTTTATILNPPSGLSSPDSNDASLVMLIDQGEIETLFTGDINSTVELEIVARETPMRADILKVAHHGSNYSTSNEFLEAVQPQDSVISVGPNPYGHPGEQTMTRLAAEGSSIWRTDLNGTVLVTSSDGVTYQVVPSKLAISVYMPMVSKILIP